MSITDKISKHYMGAISGELKKTHVKEWELDVYYRLTYPLNVESKVIELQQQGKTVEALVESIILKARDANGKRLFQDADRIKLLNEADPQVVIELASTINNARLDAQFNQVDVAKE